MILNKTTQNRMIINEFIRSCLIVDGYRKITLEEITANLGISKKTIYKVYASKNDVTRSVMMSELLEVYQNLIQLLKENNTLIQKVEMLSSIIERYIQLFNDESLKQLKKDYLVLWKEIIAFRNEKIVPVMNHFWDTAKEQNLILPIPNELIIKLFFVLQTVSTEKNYLTLEADYQSVFQSSFDILLNGILTKKGKKLLAINKRVKNENN